MPGLDTRPLSADLKPTGAWAAALLRGLARDERAGRRSPRLTEPNLDTWRRFKGRLGATHLIELLFEDAAVLHPIPFEAAAVGLRARLSQLPAYIADDWVRAVGDVDAEPGDGADYLIEQARLLGLPTRLSRSDLHVVKPHQRVLELPGTGGQLAHYLVTHNEQLTLQDNFTIAAGSWQEATLAGLVALELGAPHTRFVHRVDTNELSQADHELRDRTPDFVVGLHPDKGGAFVAADQLALWYPNAKLLLV